MIVQNGHRLAISLSSRTFGPTNWLAELWSGLHQVRTVRALDAQLDDARLAELAGHLQAIARAIFTPDNFIMAAIGESDAVDAASARTHQSRVMTTFKRPQPHTAFPLLAVQAREPLPYEGWSTSTAVAFVAQTVPTVFLSHPDAPALAVLGKMLRSLYLHREIREKGGAYGGFALYNPENGLFSLASYRDPHVVQTLKVYAGATDFIRTAPLTDEDIKEAVLQVCSEIDKPDPPGPAARKAFMRLIVGLDDETRQSFKAQLLQVTRARVRAVCDTYLEKKDRWGVSVIAGQEHLAAANDQLKGRPLALQAI
jgi:Zn-dependent M16 (insulinase) family peptidase